MKTTAMKPQQIERKVDISLACLMIKAGMRPGAIEKEAGVSRKQIAKLRRDLGCLSGNDSGPMQAVDTLLRDKNMALEASLFVHHYLFICDVEPVDVGLQVRTLIEAYDAYLDTHSSLRNGSMDLEVLLTIDNCWVIMRDWREQQINKRDCSKCGISFITSLKTNHHVCPICSGVSIKQKFNAMSSKSFMDLCAEARRMVSWGETEKDVAKALGLKNEAWVAIACELAAAPQGDQAAFAECNMTAEEAVLLYASSGIKAFTQQAN